MFKFAHAGKVVHPIQTPLYTIEETYFSVHVVTNIEIIAMELVKGGWKHNYRLL